MIGLSSRKASRDSQDMQAPYWPDGTAGAVRVLVEHPEPVGRDVITRGLRERGYEVVACGGPCASGTDRMPVCPLLEGATCSAVEGADVIVSSLHLGASKEGAIVRQIVESPTTPSLLLEASDWQVEKEFGESSTILHRYPFLSIGQIVGAIEQLGFPARGES